MLSEMLYFFFFSELIYLGNIFMLLKIFVFLTPFPSSMPRCFGYLWKSMFYYKVEQFFNALKNMIFTYPFSFHHNPLALTYPYGCFGYVWKSMFYYKVGQFFSSFSTNEKKILPFFLLSCPCGCFGMYGNQRFIVFLK